MLFMLQNGYRVIAHDRRGHGRSDQPAIGNDMDVPTLVIHSDDDQIVPIGHAGELTARIVRNAELKVYEGAPHGLASTHQDKLNADLLAFARG